jgi:small subunit ribosomal protein S15
MPKKEDLTPKEAKVVTKKETAKVTDKKDTKKATKEKSPNTVGVINVTGKSGELIKKYQRNEEDTGSTEVQIALFTAKIDQLSKHLKKHNKDSDSKRGILIMVGKRRRLLTFLQKNDPKRYDSLIADLGLRK